MNAKLSSSSLLLTAFLYLGLGSVQAQDPSVPSYINYQGSVTDANGLPLGATDATPPVAEPINLRVLFRIYDSATGPTNLLWTEEQTVTISLGQFSVLLGRGISFGSEDHGSIESVFTSNDGGGQEGPQRFLGITVDNGDNVLDDGDVAISPRQQITTTAYSFRAGTADSVASGSSLLLNNSADNGLGYFGTGRTFNSTEINGPVLYGLSGGALGSVTGTTQKTALRWNDNSQVGIGTSTLSNAAAGTKLVLQGDDSSFPPAQLSIRGNSDTDKRLVMGYNTTGNYANISSLNGDTPSPLWLNFMGGDIILGGFTSNVFALSGLKSSIAYGPNAGYSFIGDDDTGMYRKSSNQLDFHTGGENRMVINNVGQLYPLHGVFAPVSYGSSHGYSFNGDPDTGMYRPTTNQLSFHSGGVERMRLDASGKVGIGVIPDRAVLQIAGGKTSIEAISSYLQSSGAGRYGWFAPIFNADFTLDTEWRPIPLIQELNQSIWAQYQVTAEAFRSFSDERIKSIVGRSDAAKDLSTIRDIEITDYHFIDKISRGDGDQKKVIAQQLEKIYPQAVSRTTNEVPDIYQKATFEEGWVKLATDLKKGERVRLFNEEDDGVYEVLEVEKNRFRADFATDGKEVFVFGREVKDFRTVDYEAITTLNVSATQELARQLEVKDTEIKKLQEENASLRASFAAQERQISAQNARDNSLEAKLAAIEKTLSALKPGKRTASLSKSRAAE
jgi:hypothetical protein